MDEILIEEKKYVSSKRAAKMTGYAKDYVGQLCREGRVPARLVGRSWYVLETAIQDHRFGDTNELSTEAKDAALPWESPRYEAAPSEVLPTINRLQQATQQVVKTAELPKEPEKTVEVPGNLQDSWQAWFSNFDAKAEIGPAVTAEEPEKVEEPYEEPKEEQKIEIEVEKDVQIPIHTIYQLPPEELLPHRARNESVQDERDKVLYESKPEKARRGLSRGAIQTIQTTGVLLALVMATVAVIGSGYLDEYIISSSQARIIAGVALYNR